LGNRAVVAAIGNGAGFTQGRDFGAWLGLVPKQESTGDRTILGKISKRGNINFFTTELAAKRLELLRELVPGITRVAVLVHPANPNTEPTLKGVEAAARSMGLQVQVFNASSRQDIDAVFATLVRERPDGLFIGVDPFFKSRRVQLTNLTVRYAIPAAFSQREYAEVGGLMSYGSNITDAYRQIGVYVGRILKGVKPADLPVVQSTKFELVINAQTARMLSLTVPASLLALADEVIE
jgi:putative tryptophan/tyrosine transport system substrate-binding protein